MITKVELENFKSFEKISVDLGKFNVLIGPNNSGKSNFCSALKLVNNLSTKPTNTVFDGRHRSAQLLRNGTGISKIVLNASTGEEIFKYAITIKATNENNRNPISGEIIFSNEELITQRINLDVTPFRSTVSYRLKTNDSILYKQELQNGSILDVSQYSSIRDNLRSLAYFKLIPESINEPASIKENAQVNIDEMGGGLPAVLTQIMLNDKKDKTKFYDNIVEELCKKFNEIDNIYLEPTDFKCNQGKSHQGYRIVFKIRDMHEGLESPHISDGISYFLLFLAITSLPNRPSTIIIEEPENGIHPSNLKEIIGYISQLCDEKNCQVIITTHSPYLLDFVDKEDVLIFYREDEGPTRIKRMADFPRIDKKLKYMMLGELWTEKGEKGIFEEIENAKT